MINAQLKLFSNVLSNRTNSIFCLFTINYYTAPTIAHCTIYISDAALPSVSTNAKFGRKIMTKCKKQYLFKHIFVFHV